MAAFFWHPLRIFSSLRAFRHVFSGFGYARVGLHRRALQAYRRALQLDPNNKLAHKGFQDIHRLLDTNTLVQDSQTRALVDVGLCLERVGALLAPDQPTSTQLEEANRLLDLVPPLAPELQPTIDYWRAVALIRARQYELAEPLLTHLLDPDHYGPDNRHRQSMLLDAWRLAMNVEELRCKVGTPQLALPGRRIEAIRVVERYLADKSQDQEVWGMKRILYHEVTQAEYDACVGVGQMANDFDHEYVQQLGLALIDDNARWQRGGEYLRMAARGMPASGPSLFVQIAQAHQRTGHSDESRHNYELAKRAGRSIGPRNLADSERQAYFSALKILADDAIARNDFDSAVENLHLYTESERSGIETLRKLADLHERRGDPLSALRVTDHALVYDPKDKDLMERKDRYYYSVMPDYLRTQVESVRTSFDVGYCIHRARTILDNRRYEGLAWLDVAHHLCQLVLVVYPTNREAKVLLARVQLRYGERDAAIRQLEEIHGTAEKFENEEDEEAWYTAAQLLGDLYMETGRPDLAAPCFLDYRKSSKSGAKTLFKLGQAYEQLGDSTKAIHYYKQVTAYDGNPLTSDAYDALHRLEDAQAS